MSKLYELQSKITGDFAGGIMLPSRRLVRQGPLHSDTGTAQEAILCSDILLWCSSAFKFQGHLALAKAVVQPWGDEKEPSKKRVGFEVKDPDQTLVFVCAGSDPAKEQKEWVDDISAAITAHNRDETTDGRRILHVKAEGTDNAPGLASPKVQAPRATVVRGASTVAVNAAAAITSASLGT